MNTPFIPIGDRILLKPLNEVDAYRGSIIIPECARHGMQSFTVEAISETAKARHDIKLGSRVLIGKYAADGAASQVSVDEEKLVVVTSDDLLAILDYEEPAPPSGVNPDRVVLVGGKNVAAAAVLLICMVISMALAACSSSDPSANATIAQTAAVPDLTDGQPMIVNNCQHDANVAFAKLAKIKGTSPHLLDTWYTANGVSYGHEMCEFTWANQTKIVTRAAGSGAQSVIDVPSSIKASDAMGLARFAIPTSYLATFVKPDPNLVTHSSPVANTSAGAIP